MLAIFDESYLVMARPDWGSFTMSESERKGDLFSLISVAAQSEHWSFS